MRAALIFVCGLGAFSAVSATIEESQLGIRQSRSPAGVVKTESVAQDLGLEARITSGSGPDETLPRPARKSCQIPATTP